MNLSPLFLFENWKNKTVFAGDNSQQEKVHLRCVTRQDGKSIILALLEEAASSGQRWRASAALPNAKKAGASSLGVVRGAIDMVLQVIKDRYRKRYARKDEGWHPLTRRT